MIRLTLQNKNTPEEYDSIFKQRKGYIDWQDLRRQKAMLKYFKGGNILDIGCLDSVVPHLLIEYTLAGDSRYVGTDVATEVIRERNLEFYDCPGVAFLVDDIYNSKLDKKFNYVLLGEVLEHLQYPQDATYKALDLVKQGGWLVISVPYKEHLEPGAVDGDRHIWSFDKKDFEFLKEYGEVKYKILRSQYFPKYKYCWPQLIIYVKKYGS